MSPVSWGSCFLRMACDQLFSSCPRDRWQSEKQNQSPSWRSDRLPTKSKANAEESVSFPLVPPGWQCTLICLYRFRLTYCISHVIAITKHNKHVPHEGGLLEMTRPNYFCVPFFCVSWLTASAMPSPGAGCPERLSVHAAPSELLLLTAPIQRQGWTFSWAGPRPVHRCTQDAALSTLTQIMRQYRGTEERSTTTESKSPCLLCTTSKSKRVKTMFERVNQWIYAAERHV